MPFFLVMGTFFAAAIARPMGSVSIEKHQGTLRFPSQGNNHEQAWGLTGGGNWYCGNNVTTASGFRSPAHRRIHRESRFAARQLRKR
jgi:hypothetical protein